MILDNFPQHEAHSNERGEHGTHYAFETVDVFARCRFEGNPLAVFHQADGLSTEDMQSLARELNLSETTFVLPPADSANTARLRIFHRTAELPFAGHPNVGTAFVLARLGRTASDLLRFEEAAGLVDVRLVRDERGATIGATIRSPQALTLGEEVPAAEVAACAGIGVEDVVTRNHLPRWATVGNPYVIAEVTLSGLSHASPDLAAFRRAVAGWPESNGRYSMHLYAHDGERVRARMFAPLAGTWEDPATGSANAPLGGLLLSLTGGSKCEYTVLQGVEMGRPSTLHVRAWREAEEIHTSVSGSCVSVLSGTARV